MTNPDHIQYRGYYRGPKDTGGTTSLYASPADALAQAKACSFKDETAWVNPEFVGMMDTVLRANVPIDYIEWKPTPARKTIQAGECFKVGDILVADHQVTRAAIGLWLIVGRAEVV
jgi:hypothetical protein